MRPLPPAGREKCLESWALFGYGVRTLSRLCRPGDAIAGHQRDDLVRLMTADHRIAVGLLRAVAKRLIEVNERKMGEMSAAPRTTNP